MKTIPKLEALRLEGIPYPVVDPSALPAELLQALNKYMVGKTVCHSIYIYIEDWEDFCCAIEREDIDS
ncbi:hypothetical protein BCU45_002950 [Vibrio lentus]|uniref:hypothetical protein n=1 Tax=Vibrio lentus TaxID=136468 RepID=UPI000C85058D|nr:hypothetical protein [Vibrio lentus]PMI43070.1 hypothetical protein BCU45_12005 [Vibrio lentus]